MLGAGFAYLLTRVKDFLQRQALIYGLMAAGGLIVIFAAGYGLDALRTMLMLRVGGVYASLIVGGMLLALALICFGMAIYLGRSPRPTGAARRASSPYSNPPRRPLVTGSAMLAGGAVTGLVAGVLAAKRPWRNSDHPGAETEGIDKRGRRAPPR